MYRRLSSLKVKAEFKNTTEDLLDINVTLRARFFTKMVIFAGKKKINISESVKEWALLCGFLVLNMLFYISVKFPAYFWQLLDKIQLLTLSNI